MPIDAYRSAIMKNTFSIGSPVRVLLAPRACASAGAFRCVRQLESGCRGDAPRESRGSWLSHVPFVGNLNSSECTRIRKKRT